jgi:hypothetical protein
LKEKMISDAVVLFFTPNRTRIFKQLLFPSVLSLILCCNMTMRTLLQQNCSLFREKDQREETRHAQKHPSLQLLLVSIETRIFFTTRDGSDAEEGASFSSSFLKDTQAKKKIHATPKCVDEKCTKRRENACNSFSKEKKKTESRTRSLFFCRRLQIILSFQGNVLSRSREVKKRDSCAERRQDREEKGARDVMT